MLSPATEPTDHKNLYYEWILQLNLKRFEPIGSIAKKRMKEAFGELENLKKSLGTTKFDEYQKRMSLERFNRESFYRIMDALMARQTFRQEYNISYELARWVTLIYQLKSFDDVRRIWSFYNLICNDAMY
ncbi:hypothetical protein Ddc_22900 [Ditylenchus destructor]|nr:hypothetical protein Ddc_22900 [Ditylenchus destructor]